MKSLSFILDNYLKGKATFGPVRRILDIVFSAGISAFLFQHFYFNYHLLDITDYKGIIEFFLKGIFFIPLALFLFVHYGLYLFSALFFTLSTTRKSTQWVEGIIRARLSKKELTSALKKMGKHRVTGKYVNLNFTPSWITETYLNLKENINTEQWRNAEAAVKKENQNVEKNFLLNVKAIAAISVYFFSIPYFGMVLYVSCIAVLIASLIFLWYTFLVLDVLPVLVRKIDFEMQEFIKKQEPDRESVN